MIGVTVGDENPGQRGAIERGSDRIEVGRQAHARVNERRVATAQEPRVVPGGSRPLRGVAGGNQQGGHRSATAC